jgi:hypothetical protein
VLRPRIGPGAGKRRHPRPQHRLAAHFLHLSRGAAEPQRESPVAFDEQPVAALVRGRPLREDPLVAVRGSAARRQRIVPRRRDPGGEREAAGQAQRGIVRHRDVRTEREHLMPARIVGVGRRVDDALLHAGPFRVRVAVDHADDVGVEARHIGTDHELDRVARLCGQVIGVTDDPHSIEPLLCRVVRDRLRAYGRRAHGGHQQCKAEQVRDEPERPFLRHAILLWDP